MRNYKRLFSLLVLLSALVFAVGYAQAAPAWYTCTVVMAGHAGTDTVLLKLTDTAAAPAFAGKVFSIGAAAQKSRGLAVGLTALTNGNKVKVYVDPTVGTYPEIQTLYLLAE